MGKVAVILSGCGYLDGSEIHESVFCLYHLEKQGHSYGCFAPDIAQNSVINHVTKEPVQTESRNVMIESARISRGNVNGLKTLNVSEFDALLMPGGFGVAKNLSNFAEKAENCEVNEDLKRVVEEFVGQKKPIGATCISPVLLAKVFQGKLKLEMTFGQDEKNNEILTKFDMVAKPADVDEVVVDSTHKIYTTPCYMEPPNIVGCFEGIEKLIDEML